jgi:hypothetical protein
LSCIKLFFHASTYPTYFGTLAYNSIIFKCVLWAMLYENLNKIYYYYYYYICNWTSNCRPILKSIPEEFRAQEVKELKLVESLPMGRVLGMSWDPEEDQFIWKCNLNKVPQEVVSGEKIPTKREILGLFMSVYDPLGFLGYLTIKAKIILQEIWRSGIGWDDDIAGSTYEKWTEWLNELNNFKHEDPEKLLATFEAGWSQSTSCLL